MSPKLRRGLTLVLALTLCVSAAVVLRRLVQYRQAAEEYEEAQSLAGLPDLSDLETQLPAPPAAEEPETSGETGEETEEPPQEEVPYVDPYADALAAMDFSALREVNGDVVGWILIPGTAVSYPLLQTSNNQYYLSHTWKGLYNLAGSIFLECQNSRDLSDFNTVIYGHRMADGSMFTALKNYQQQSWWEQHPTVYLTDDSGTRCYEIFAAYEVSTQGDTYRLAFSGDGEKQDFLDFCLAQSAIDTGIVPTVQDRILTLSTCTGHGHATRWVVQAALRQDPGDPS